MKRMIRIGVAGVCAGFLAACANSSAVKLGQAGISQAALITLPSRAQLHLVELSGSRIARTDWDTAAQQNLDTAIRAQLQARNLAARSPVQFDADALQRAESVLPAAAAFESARPVSVSDWSIGPVCTQEALALAVFAQSDFNSAGHQIAQVGLGAALATPTAPYGGPRQIYGALIECHTGNLHALARIPGGDVRDAEEAEQIVSRLLVALLEPTP